MYFTNELSYETESLKRVIEHHLREKLTESLKSVATLQETALPTADYQKRDKKGSTGE
jgi:hypothetical protein